MFISNKEFAEIKSLLINISKDLKDIKERLMKIEERINFEGYEELTEEEKKLVDEGLKSESLSEEELWKVLEE